MNRLAYFFRKLTVLLLSLLILAAASRAQPATCQTTTGITKFSLPDFQLTWPYINFYSFTASQGKTIIFYQTGSLGPDPRNWLNVLSIDENGNLLWSVAIDQTFSDHGYGWDAGTELSDGSLVLLGGGGMAADYEGPYPAFSIMRLDANGVLLWQKEYNTTDLPGYQIFATGQGTFCTTGGPSLWKFDSNGNILWKKELILPNTNFEANGGNGLLSGNRIITANLFTYETPDLDMRRGAFLSAMDSETGELVSSRCYQFNDADWHYDSIVLADLYLAKAGDQKLFLLANIASENSSVDSYHITLNDDLSSSDLATEIIVKNRTFEPHSVNSRWQALPGGVLSGSFGDPSDRSVQYLALVDTAYRILMQRKITLPRPAYFTSVSKALSGSLGCIYSSTVVDLSSYLFYDQISPDLISGGCNGVDTAFLTTRRIRISELNVPIRYSDAGEATASEIHPGQSSFSLSKDIVCRQQSRCDSLRITGPNSICNNQPASRFTAFKNADCLSKTIWSIDSTAVTGIERINDTTITITFGKDWNGWLYASLPACDKKDSLLIHAISGAGTLSLGNDTSLCPQSTLLLRAPWYKTYQWQDGSTDSTYLVSRTGAYSLQATDGCNFSHTGSIRIMYYEADSSGAYDAAVCPTPPLMVQSPKTLKDYRWSPASSLQGSDNASEVQLRAADVSEVFLSGHTVNDCLVNDTVKIQYKDCSRFIRVPNAFSPNGDGRNDYLTPLVHGQLTSYEFAVYNVWGELIFHTSNPGDGWDGRFKGIMQPPGSFVWFCKYRFKGEAEQTDKGTLVLLR